MRIVKKCFKYGEYEVVLETGRIAKQATSAVLIDMGGTTVLVTVVAAKKGSPDKGFFPLTVNYREKTYAAGKIPGGYFKREGRPGEYETLTSRLIDRPIRPLFPDWFTNEVQIIATVKSINPNVSPDIVALLGASAALTISGIPFKGPIGAARVGYENGGFLLNPSFSELTDSELDLVVAGTKSAVLMVESEAKLLPEDVMLDAVWYGHEQMQVAIEAIKDFADEVGTTAWDLETPEFDSGLYQMIKDNVMEELQTAYQITEKMRRKEEIGKLLERVVNEFSKEDGEPTAEAVKKAFEKLEREIIRVRILDGLSRIDGRDTRTVRSLSTEVGVLSRTHGSALFTRGETQAMVVTTLGTERDAQSIDALIGETKDRFMFHYNFPPFCVGEIGFLGSPKRREIGHGRLARRGLHAVLPKEDEFKYVIRVVSEITEANGSSSMASVCGASLSLMDAGVPIKSAVAGIAMGLIKDGNKFAVLTDILGDEDHFGDMDFKVVGAKDGITALQMDIKIDGITKYIMQQALQQAKEGRLYILEHMNKVISKSREDVSNYAPRIYTMKVPVSKIRDVIGKGGVTIRGIISETGVDMDVSDDGVINISAVDSNMAEAAKARIEAIIAELEIGKIYTGKVSRVMDFGAVVSVLPGKDGFLHISQICDERIKSVSDKLKEGQEVTVKVLEIDQRQGKVRLTMKPSLLDS